MVLGNSFIVHRQICDDTPIVSRMFRPALPQRSLAVARALGPRSSQISSSHYASESVVSSTRSSTYLNHLEFRTRTTKFTRYVLAAEGHLNAVAKGEGKKFLASELKILLRCGLPRNMQALSEAYGLERAERYEIIRTIGRGTFGEVLLAWDNQSERPTEFPGNTGAGLKGRRPGGERGHGYVALKSVASGVASGGGLSKGLFRELRGLQMLEDCVHVVRLLNVYPEGPNAILVLEYMPSDLAKILDNTPCPLGEGDCKAFTIMLLRGLAFMHSHGLLHRDIKPSNLLISSGGVLKIADFGQTRTHTEPQTRSYSHQVATRWYRAPELLYGTRRYGFAVDMWAAGTVVGEMLAGRPLFQGRSDIDQLHKILQVTGTPTEQSWPGVKDLPDYDKVYFVDLPPQNPEIILQGCSREARDLAWQLLQLDPKNRPSAPEALRHTLFLMKPEATPCHLLPIVNIDRQGDAERCKRGEAFLDEGWSEA